MTPKEKAEGLIKKFYLQVQWKLGQEDCLDRAKKCSLIAVNEILLSNNTFDFYNVKHDCHKYWEEVKEEIISL